MEPLETSRAGWNLLKRFVLRGGHSALCLFLLAAFRLGTRFVRLRQRLCEQLWRRGRTPSLRGGSREVAGCFWCICIWANSNYVLQGQSEDLPVNCAAIPENVLMSSYSLDKFQQCGLMPWSCSRYVTAIEQMCSMCNDLAPEEKAGSSLPLSVQRSWVRLKVLLRSLRILCSHGHCPRCKVGSGRGWATQTMPNAPSGIELE